MTPRGLIQRALVITLVYGALHLAGGRGDAGFLSGTPVGGTGAVLLGCAYVVTHFLFVIVAPILALAAAFLAARR